MSSFLKEHNQIIREFIAEFIGTFMLIVVGDGSVVTALKRNPPETFAINFCFGVGALIGVTAALPVSGAHINPAVTIALASVGKFPWKKTIHYILAQVLGAFVAAAVVLITYFQLIEDFDGGERSAYGTLTSTGSIFAPYPAHHVTFLGALVDQIVGTCILLFAIVAVTDENGIKTPKYIMPMIFALIITGVCFSMGVNCGAILNPARDLGPRLLMTVAGWGFQPFKPLNGHFWWIAGIVGPLIGGVLGAWLYYITFELLAPASDSRRDSNSSFDDGVIHAKRKGSDE